MRTVSSSEINCENTFSVEVRQERLSPNQGVQLCKRQFLRDPSLSLESNNSLGLLGTPSLEQGMPIPRCMLSHSEDAEMPAEENQEKEQVAPLVPCVLKEEEEQWLAQSLGLNKLLPVPRRFANNTKNVLRNFGNAQNQYALYHHDAKEIIQKRLCSPQRFQIWLRNLRLQKFEHFQAVWAKDSHSHNGKSAAFRKTYRQICKRFYLDNAIPYVLASRMKNQETKLSHLRYIYRFLQGLKAPENFCYFKKQLK